jgi:hypothetical protein
MKKQILFIAILGVAAINTMAQITLVLQPDGTAGKDAEVFSCIPCGYPDNNYGDKQDFNAIAWTNNGDESNVRSLIQFDLSSIPAGATINFARLSLWNNPTSLEGGDFSGFFTPNASKIQRITQPWDEHTVTWNNQPTATKLHQASLHHTTSSHQDFLHINVTALVQDMIDHPATSFGFRLRLKKEEESRKLIFASSDNPDASIRPKLVVTYTPMSPRVSSETLPSIASSASLKSFKIVPNPARDEVKLWIENAEKDVAQITVYDINKRKVFTDMQQLVTGSNQFQLNAVGWRKGIYIVSIKTSKEVITQKLIVE